MRAENYILNSAFQCLAHERRRHILSFLQNNEGDTASVDDLVDHVIEQERHSPASTREEITIDLYHNQLPLLADHGLIDFDVQTKRVHYKSDEEIAVVVDHICHLSPLTASAAVN